MAEEPKKGGDVLGSADLSDVEPKVAAAKLAAKREGDFTLVDDPRRGFKLIGGRKSDPELEEKVSSINPVAKKVAKSDGDENSRFGNKFDFQVELTHDWIDKFKYIKNRETRDKLIEAYIVNKIFKHLTRDRNGKSEAEEEVHKIYDSLWWYRIRKLLKLI